MISFVVVLPALPVIATTCVPEARRTCRASRCSARVVSSTCTATMRRTDARRHRRRIGHDHAGGAGPEGLADEPVAVEALAR